MEKPKFKVFLDRSGDFRFALIAKNGENILRSSEGYSSKQGCIYGIGLIRKYSKYDSLFNRMTANDGSYYFTIKSVNGQVIGISEMYDTISGTEKGIDAVKKDAPAAPIQDLT